MSLSDLPLASGKEHVKAFKYFGWIVRREAEHIIMTHPDRMGITLSIPNHKEVRRGTLKSLLKSAGITDKIYRDVFDAN
jgi:predicted RNA binding protein YcfA (HicA-like mRNA interferase family)